MIFWTTVRMVDGYSIIPDGIIDYTSFPKATIVEDKFEYFITINDKKIKGPFTSLDEAEKYAFEKLTFNLSDNIEIRCERVNVQEKA